MKGRLLIPACVVATGLLGAGCSREPEPVASAPPPAAADPGALQAQTWIDDVQMGSAVTAQQTIATPQSEFAPGDPIHLVMSVEDAPSTATVTVQWYGPQNLQLGYENKEVTPAQQQLTFEQDNTADWQSGDYRAEVWVGDEKVAEKSFHIVADTAAGA